MNTGLAQFSFSTGRTGHAELPANVGGKHFGESLEVQLWFKSRKNCLTLVLSSAK